MSTRRSINQPPSSLPPPAIGKRWSGNSYALSPIDGYEGLLLRAISQRLAETVYPYIASERLEPVWGLINMLANVAIIALYLVRGISAWLVPGLSFIILVPACQRLSMIDVRILAVLVRQFDSW